MCVQNCQVDDILSSHCMGNGNVVGADLAAKLKGGCLPSQQERHFLVRTVGRHLMYNCTV